jgi:hypothetical protein
MMRAVSIEAADSRYEKSRQDAKCDGGNRALKHTMRHDGKGCGDDRQTSQNSGNVVKVEVISPTVHAFDVLAS